MNDKDKDLGFNLLAVGSLLVILLGFKLILDGTDILMGIINILGGGYMAVCLTKTYQEGE
ncbi:MAG: hypothetical protein ACRCXZ_03240 [Patescibacteria group bacterium]